MPFGERLRNAWRRLVDFVEAALGKGQKKPSLRDLSNVLVLDEHIQDILHELDNQSDRGVALIAAAIVDLSLGRLMRCRLVDYKNCSEILFEKEGAPLSAFSAKIKIARAIGVVGPYTEGHLDSIRQIRNQFAHSPLKIDFTNPLIAAEINKLLPDNAEWKPEWTPERRRFIGTTIILAQALETRATEHVQDRIDIWLN